MSWLLLGVLSAVALGIYDLMKKAAVNGNAGRVDNQRLIKRVALCCHIFLAFGSFRGILCHMKLSIHAYNDSTRPKLTHVVRVPAHDGKKRTRRFFKSRAAAERYCREKQRELDALGLDAGTLDDDDKMVVSRFKRKLPDGHTLEDAFRFYLKHIDQTQRSITIKDASTEFLNAMAAAGKSDRYRGDLKSKIRAFVRDHGERIVSEITTADASRWISEREGRNITRNSYRRVLCTFFVFCCSHGYALENPIGRVQRAKPQPSPTLIFTPREMRHLLNASSGDVRAYLAIGGLAGLRESEIRRLQWEAFLWKAGKIDLSSGITKTAKRRLVEILPVLGEWLTPYMTESGPVCKPGFDRRLRIFKKSLPFEWKLNGMRHSFASYHLAHFKDPGRVSLELGHTDAGLVFRHYRELVEESAAQEWWNEIRPEASKIVEFETQKRKA